MDINLTSRCLKYRSHLQPVFGTDAEHQLIKITILDDERIGLGECSVVQGVSCDAEAYVRMGDVAHLCNEALASEDYATYLRPYPALLFALESAMHDIRQTEILYSTPFALSRQGLPLVGELHATSFDELLAQAKAKLLAGYKALKMDIGVLDWQEELQLLRLLRQRFPARSLQLRLNAGGRFSPEEAEEMLGELKGLEIHSVQQPLARYQWTEMARLCQRSPVPVALCEELCGMNRLDEKQALLDVIQPQYLAIKPMLHGGISGSIEWVSEARKRGMASWMAHSGETSIGLRNLALLAGFVYGQGQLLEQELDGLDCYVDNFEMDIEVRRGRLWRCEVE